jgi:hypothetical protein
MVGMIPAGTEISHSALYHVYRVHSYSLPTKMLRGFIICHVCYVSHPSHSPEVNFPNNIR